MRKLRPLAMTLVAVFAMGAVMSSGASATSFHWNSKAADGHTILNGSQIGLHKFTTTAGEVTCEEANFSGTTIENTTTDTTTTPTFGKCHINFFGSKVAATVTMNGCTLTVTSHRTTAGVTTSTKIHLICTFGEGPKITAAGCTIKVNEGQTWSGGSAENVENHLKVILNINTIAYSHSGFTCGTGSGTTGTYKGETTVKGSATNGSAVSISYDVAP